MSPEQIDVDHGFYIDAVVQAFKAAGLTVTEYEALADTHREAVVKLVLPDQAPEFRTVLVWDEERGWQRGYTDARHSECGIQGLTDLICDDRYLDTVAFPTTVADAVLKMTHDVPEDVDEALAAYLPAEPEPDPSDPRQIATDLIHQNIREGAMRHVRIAVSEQYDLKALGRDGYAAKCEEVREHIARATVTVEIPDEVTA